MTSGRSERIVGDSNGGLIAAFGWVDSLWVLCASAGPRGGRVPVQSKVYNLIPNHIICKPCRKLCKPVYEGDDDVLDVNGGLELCAGLKEVGEGAEVELVGEHLDDALHQILLE